jgi:N,N'-diacetyllegionaminate synthase
MQYQNKYKFGNTKINPESKTYIIAEAGVSHFGSLKKAYKLVDLAKFAGADAVKFQAYITEELIDKKFKSWFKRYKSKEVNFDFFEKIQLYCEKKKITFLCTPHSNTAIKWVQKLNIPVIKIGSGELKNYDFLQRVISLNKPIIVSTGMHDVNDLKNLDIFFKKKNFKKVIFLKCTSVYPSKYDLLNLRNLELFKKIFNNAVIGYSDHTAEDLSCIVAASLNYKIIEKHISLDFNVKNAQDWKVSLDKFGLRQMIEKIKLIDKIKGSANLKLSIKEKKNKIWATKSLYYKKFFDKGHKIKYEDIDIKRPGNGIKPDNINKILGKMIKKKLISKKVKLQDFD